MPRRKVAAASAAGYTGHKDRDYFTSERLLAGAPADVRRVVERAAGLVMERAAGRKTTSVEAYVREALPGISLGDSCRVLRAAYRLAEERLGAPVRPDSAARKA
jgi:hypothetical protein